MFPHGQNEMLRLTRISLGTSEVVLKVQGQIVGEWVALLESECRELLAKERQVTLDLSEVSYLDRQAVRLLREFRLGSLGLVNCPPLVEELLTEDAVE
jgi:anti-anti-sigma regulatory factor